MTRTHIKLAAALGALLLYGGCASAVFAQHFSPISQGILNTSNQDFGQNLPPCSGFCDVLYTINAGTGYSGTTTGAFLTYAFNKIGTANYAPTDLTVEQLDSMGTNIGTCDFQGTNPVSGSVSGSFPTQLIYNPAGSSGTGCVLDPALSVRILIFYQYNSSGLSNFTYYGEATSTHPEWTVSDNRGSNISSFPNFVPYFALVTGGFQITPTASSSGIFFSGAIDFCNSAFASTTGIGATIGNGLCIATGFLFVPTAESYSQFMNLPGLLQQTPPLSWIHDLAGIYSEAQASSSPNFINLSIDFGATTTKAVGIEKLDVISTTTISKYLPESLRQGILVLEGAVFLAGAASAIYFTLKHIWKTT